MFDRRQIAGDRVERVPRRQAAMLADGLTRLAGRAHDAGPRKHATPPQYFARCLHCLFIAGRGRGQHVAQSVARRILLVQRSRVSWHGGARWPGAAGPAEPARLQRRVRGPGARAFPCKRHANGRRARKARRTTPAF